MKIGTRPAAGTLVFLSESQPAARAPDEAMRSAKPAAHRQLRGRFTFERVIPAELSVSRFFTLERLSGSWGAGDSRIVMIEPNKTTSVDLGGMGRPVIGRFVLPSGIKPSAVFSRVNQSLELIRPEPPFPKGLNRQRRETWLAEWLSTEAGKAYTQSKRSYDTNVRPDGGSALKVFPPANFEIVPRFASPGTIGP